MDKEDVRKVVAGSNVVVNMIGVWESPYELVPRFTCELRRLLAAVWNPVQKNNAKTNGGPPEEPERGAQLFCNAPSGVACDRSVFVSRGVCFIDKTKR